MCGWFWAHAIHCVCVWITTHISLYVDDTIEYTIPWKVFMCVSVLEWGILIGYRIYDANQMNRHLDIWPTGHSLFDILRDSFEWPSHAITVKPTIGLFLILWFAFPFFPFDFFFHNNFSGVWVRAINILFIFSPLFSTNVKIIIIIIFTANLFTFMARLRNAIVTWKTGSTHTHSF